MSTGIQNKGFVWISLIFTFCWIACGPRVALAQNDIDATCRLIDSGGWQSTAVSEDGEGEDDDEIEIILDGSSGPLTWGEKDGGEDDDEIEIILDGLIGHGTAAVGEARLRRGCLCRQLTLDDHGDTLGCATEVGLGELTFGDLGMTDQGFGKVADGTHGRRMASHRRGQDRDLFLIALPGVMDESQPWRWTWSGEVAAHVSLLDASGRPLVATGVEAGDLKQWDIMLVPGIYYLEISAVATEGGTYGWSVTP